MPIMDGYEVLSQIISINSMAQVIVLTADTQDETKKKALQLGAKNVYEKPISLKNMQNIFIHDLVI